MSVAVLGIQQLENVSAASHDVHTEFLNFALVVEKYLRTPFFSTKCFVFDG